MRLFLRPPALFFILLSLQYIGNLSASHQKPILSFSNNGTFTVVIFTDLHYGENAWDTWGPQQDEKSTRVMNVILDIEKPDFVIFLGDQITANNLMSTNASNYWEMLTTPCRNRKIPWTSVMGNHDSSPFEWDKSWFGPNGIPRPYSIPEDSGGGDTPEVISYAQSQFLNDTMNDVNKDGRPEYLFFHIPLPAMETVAPIISESKIQAPCAGNNGAENVSPVESDWGLIDILENRSSFQATFSGHNHGNDWCCPYKQKLWLCYGRHSGYGGYGRWKRGAKILKYIESPFKLQTWLRFEDGTVADLGDLPNLRESIT